MFRIAKVVTVVLGVAISGVAMAGTAVAAPAAPVKPASVTGLNESGDFAVSGVRIRSCASSSCSTNGLGYPGQGLNLSCAQYTSGAAWIEVRNATTNVHGWSARELIYASCD